MSPDDSKYNRSVAKLELIDNLIKNNIKDNPQKISKLKLEQIMKIILIEKDQLDGSSMSNLMSAMANKFNNNKIKKITPQFFKEVIENMNNKELNMFISRMNKNYKEMGNKQLEFFIGTLELAAGREIKEIGDFNDPNLKINVEDELKEVYAYAKENEKVKNIGKDIQETKTNSELDTYYSNSSANLNNLATNEFTETQQIPGAPSALTSSADLSNSALPKITIYRRGSDLGSSGLPKIAVYRRGTDTTMVNNVENTKLTGSQPSLFSGTPSMSENTSNSFNEKVNNDIDDINGMINGVVNAISEKLGDIKGINKISIVIENDNILVKITKGNSIMDYPVVKEGNKLNLSEGSTGADIKESDGYKEVSRGVWGKDGFVPNNRSSSLNSIDKSTKLLENNLFKSEASLNRTQSMPKDLNKIKTSGTKSK